MLRIKQPFRCSTGYVSIKDKFSYPEYNWSLITNHNTFDEPPTDTMNPQYYPFPQVPNTELGPIEIIGDRKYYTDFVYINHSIAGVNLLYYDAIQHYLSFSYNSFYNFSSIINVIIDSDYFLISGFENNTIDSKIVVLKNTNSIWDSQSQYTEKFIRIQHITDNTSLNSYGKNVAITSINDDYIVLGSHIYQAISTSKLEDKTDHIYLFDRNLLDNYLVDSNSYSSYTKSFEIPDDYHLYYEQNQYGTMGTVTQSVILGKNLLFVLGVTGTNATLTSAKLFIYNLNQNINDPWVYHEMDAPKGKMAVYDNNVVIVSTTNLKIIQMTHIDTFKTKNVDLTPYRNIINGVSVDFDDLIVDFDGQYIVIADPTRGGSYKLLMFNLNGTLVFDTTYDHNNSVNTNMCNIKLKNNTIYYSLVDFNSHNVLYRPTLKSITI